LKLLTTLFLFSITLFAEQLQIVADNFERNQQKKFSSFTGHVNIKKGLDDLKASQVFVYVDDKNRPIKYEASGDVSFSVTTENNVTYMGKSQLLIFLPLKKEYQFYKKVYIQEKNTARTLSGEKIVLNMTSGNAKIAGKAKVPVRVTFEIDDKNSTKTGLNNIKKDDNKTVNTDTNTSTLKDMNKNNTDVKGTL